MQDDARNGADKSIIVLYSNKYELCIKTKKKYIHKTISTTLIMPYFILLIAKEIYLKIMLEEISDFLFIECQRVNL